MIACNRYKYLELLTDQLQLFFQQSDDAISATPQQRAFYLTTQQLHMLQSLQQNQSSLTPQQQAMLVQLQHQYRAMQQHQQQLRLQQQQRGMRMGQPGYPTAYGAHPQNVAQSSGVIKNYGIPQQPVNMTSRIFKIFRPPTMAL